MTLLSACGQKSADTPEDFVFLTENIEGDEGYYSKPAIIMRATQKKRMSAPVTRSAVG